ncbi:hypothetical protein Taro_054873 [Colocasia esculenta]|uniref:Uncharacterized protein n=1 Tax=Colocasia esculenta TaxID=4460 RepID=A0A843XPL7_COLES|nr:hypothetical protein [Colocasia esculenta]
MGRLPSGDPGVERPTTRGRAWERRRGARRRWPCVVKALREFGSLCEGSCRDALPGRNNGCRGALPRFNGVASALGIAAVPVFPLVLPWARLCVDVCPRAGFALRTFW